MGCEPCEEREIENCTHPKVDMGRCMAVEQIHADEIEDSYGSNQRGVIGNGPIEVYRRHGKWLWEYADAEVA